MASTYLDSELGCLDTGGTLGGTVDEVRSCVSDTEVPQPYREIGWSRMRGGGGESEGRSAWASIAHESTQTHQLTSWTRPTWTWPCLGYREGRSRR